MEGALVKFCLFSLILLPTVLGEESHETNCKSIDWSKVPRKRSPFLYNATREVNEVQFREIFPILETNLNWKENGSILDHGSGCGTTTFDFILPIAQKWNSKIVGLDNSESMTDYSSKKFSNPLIEYVFGEATAVDSPLQGRKFDIILSLYTLQLINDYRSEIKALHDLLSKDGEIFMVVVLHCPYFELFAQLMEDPAWSAPAKAQLVVPDWSLIFENEDEGLKAAFADAGFHIKSWIREQRTHDYQSVQQWSDFAFSINSFAKQLPKKKYQKLKQLYLTYFEETEKKKYEGMGKDGNGNIHGDWPYVMRYEILNIHAKRLAHHN